MFNILKAYHLKLFYISLILLYSFCYSQTELKYIETNNDIYISVSDGTTIYSVDDSFNRQLENHGSKIKLKPSLQIQPNKTIVKRVSSRKKNNYKNQITKEIKYVRKESSVVIFVQQNTKISQQLVEHSKVYLVNSPIKFSIISPSPAISRFHITIAEKPGIGSNKNKPLQRIIEDFQTRAPPLSQYI